MKHHCREDMKLCEMCLPIERYAQIHTHSTGFQFSPLARAWGYTVTLQEMKAVSRLSQCLSSFCCDVIICQVLLLESEKSSLRIY